MGESLATVVVRAYGTRTLLSEFPSLDRGALKKLAVDSTVVDPVRVNGRPGLWISGHPHTFSYFDRDTGYEERPVRAVGDLFRSKVEARRGTALEGGGAANRPHDPLRSPARGRSAGVVPPNKV